MSSSIKNGIIKRKCRIAGIDTGLIIRQGGITEKQSRSYSAEFQGTPEIVVGLTDEYIRFRNRECPKLTFDECEYMWTGAHFCQDLLKFDGFMLHASAVVYKDKAYLFSAPSGTGKSTHTGLWLKNFDGAYILNDDKPVIRVEGDKVYAYGTPWSGKTDQNKNIGVEVGGICFLERAKENNISPISVKDAAFRILNQTIRPSKEEEMSILLSLIDILLSKVKVYIMGCNISDEAAKMAYDIMGTAE